MMQWNKLHSKSRTARQSSVASSDTTPSDSRGRKPNTLEVRLNLDRNHSRSSQFSHILPKNTPSLSNRSKEKSKERHADPLGLSVIYEPKSARSLDIILFMDLEDQATRHGLKWKLRALLAWLMAASRLTYLLLGFYPLVTMLILCRPVRAPF